MRVRISDTVLVEAQCLTDPEAKEYYRDTLEEWPDIDWGSHCYWQIFDDDTDPKGFDTVEEIYAEVFQ